MAPGDCRYGVGLAFGARSASVLDLVERMRPDVVVTDIRMPPTQTDEGIELAARLRTERPEVGVVVLSRRCS
jgi:YesN/AraC family two-component response regulator